jgi:hypothetical protein
LAVSGCGPEKAGPALVMTRHCSASLDAIEITLTGHAPSSDGRTGAETEAQAAAVEMRAEPYLKMLRPVNDLACILAVNAEN